MSAPISTRPAALLLDIDGTLIDTMPIHFKAWKEAVEAQGLEFLDWDAFLAQGGTAAEDLIERLASEQGARPDRQAILDRKSELVHALVGESSPIASAVRLAEDFRRSGGPVGLVTGGRRETVTRSLQHNRLEHLGEQVLVTPTDLEPGRGKPFPDGLLLACRTLGVVPAECVYVGDSPLDRQAAEAAGMAFLHVDDLGDGSAPWST